MKYDQARSKLKHILSTQKTVTVTRLREIIESMNIPLEGEPPETREIQYLKNEIKKLKCENRRLKKGFKHGVREQRMV